MKIIIYLFSICCLFVTCDSNSKTEMNVIQELINDNENLLGEPAKNPEKYEIQILYTQINRDENNHPHFTSHRFRVDKNQYFYPASTIKMPVAFLAFEKINNLNVEGLSKYTPLRIEASRTPQTIAVKDSTSENGLPSIAHYAKKIFLVSDNDANNRLYEFLGQDYLNDALKKKEFNNTKIVHRLGPSGAPFGVEENKFTNAFEFHDGKNIIYKQPEAYALNEYSFDLEKIKKGIGYYSNDSLINEPKDFSDKNYFAIEDMESILRSVIFPEATPKEKQFNLTDDDYQFLYKAMSMRPRESKFPKYTAEEYDSYVKFFIYGNTKERMPDNVRIMNKVGWAYGYLSDISYIVDLKNKVEFFLTAVISVNENQIYNDDKYEYETIGIPFLHNLGKVVYEYELKRDKKNQPDLSKFELDY